MAVKLITLACHIGLFCIDPDPDDTLTMENETMLKWIA